MDIWVFVEHSNGELDGVSLGLLGEVRGLARTLGGKACAVLLGAGIESLATPIAHYGADKIYLIEHRMLTNYDTCTYMRVLADLVIKHLPSMLLFVASSIGSDLAPRLAARLKRGLAANCTILRAKGGELQITRSVFMGKLYSSIAYLSSQPYIATVDSTSIDVGIADLTRKTEVLHTEVEIETKDLATKVLDFIEADPKTVPLSQAQMIVAGGRGMQGHFGLLEELAEVLGASVGGSRVAVDEGWIPFERQIGQTGQTVSPKLYIACGISGAIHHMAGIKDATSVIAINTDRNAPILKIADIKVVGDVMEVLPALISCLKTRAIPTQKTAMGLHSPR